MRRTPIALAAVVPLVLLVSAPLSSAAPPGGQVSGAIFTTDVTGVPVNLNHYGAKEDVYLNGGPGLNAPDSAAGLPAGTYTFQVTGPKPTQLLSSDPLACRQFTVDASGVIQWSRPVAAVRTRLASTARTTGSPCSSSRMQTPPTLAVSTRPGSPPRPGSTAMRRFAKFGCFNPRYSKTDNFKVKHDAIVEIDTRFWKNGQALLGMAAGWTDTVGASNVKYSEYNPAILAYNEAHVEAAEEGTHSVDVASQTGCTIDHVTGPFGEDYKNGSGKYSVSVTVAPWSAGDDTTYRVEVYCK